MQGALVHFIAAFAGNFVHCRKARDVSRGVLLPGVCKSIMRYPSKSVCVDRSETCIFGGLAGNTDSIGWQQQELHDRERRMGT